VPARHLFDEKALGEPAEQPAASTWRDKATTTRPYCKTCSFATLNTETADEDEDGNKQRVWRARMLAPSDLDKYLIHTVYRYKSDFKDPTPAIALFRKVPFLNGGLFECLDKLVTDDDLERDPELWPSS
jgi:adenine-specific DNA-methyltransferase